MDERLRRVLILGTDPETLMRLALIVRMEDGPHPLR